MLFWFKILKNTHFQSVRAKFDELNIFIEHLIKNFSAICTQESCISDNDDL